MNEKLNDKKEKGWDFLVLNWGNSRTPNKERESKKEKSRFCPPHIPFFGSLTFSDIRSAISVTVYVYP